MNLNMRNLSLVFVAGCWGAFGTVFYNAIWGYGAGWWLNRVGVNRRAGKVG